METATVLFHHVYRVFDLPEDIVSDRGTQFTSRVWNAFCSLLNINVSHTWSFHPQSNSQTECLKQEIGWHWLVHTATGNNRDGLSFSHGQNAPRTHSSICRWDSCPSNVSWVTKHLCSRGPIGVAVNKEFKIEAAVSETEPLLHKAVQDRATDQPCCKQVPPTYHISSMFHVSLLKPAHARWSEA